jgi:two-component system alkaline phosphatase synthesis response regulator PhoP
MSKRILLCDDEPHILRAAEFKFKRSGYDVRCAGDGAEAWRLIQEQIPDVLVTDCQMPELDGLELAARTRANPATAGLPVIMLTAKGYELSGVENDDRYGLSSVLFKPFSPRELFERVERLLEKRQLEGAAQ